MQEIIQTPAYTARADLLANSPRRAEYARYRAIRQRAQAIQNEMVIGEELIALFRIDPEGARARFQEIRVIARQRAAGEVPQVNISADQMKRYSRARSLRGKPAAWQNKYEEIFSDQIEASFTVVEERIASDTETVNWLISCVPSIAEYTGIDGKTEFDDDVDITVKEVDGGRQTSRHSDAYRSLLRTFDGFINKFQEVVDTYEDELALAETDPIGDLITVVESLGLVRCWENSEDGILWFNDSETDQKYYLSLCSHVSAYGYGGASILDTAQVRPERSQIRNWKDNWHVDLTQSVIYYRSGGFKSLKRITEDYFGAWGILESWLRQSIEAGNIAPEHFTAAFVR